MYDNLYSIKQIHTPFYHTNESEVPSIASVKWCPSNKQKLHETFQNQIRAEIEKVAEYNPLVSIPEILPSVAASEWPDGHQGFDTRPRFLDPLSGNHCLIDSGSAITAIAAGPDDKVRPDLALVAANGTLIECCGYKKVTFQIGRKQYEITAAIAKIKDTIIGWDFIKKFRLSFWWSNWGDCYLYDRKAKIKKLLEYVTLPHQSRPHLESIRVLEESFTPAMCFDVAAMANCDSADTSSADAEKFKIPPEYQTLIDRYPSLLKSEFIAKSNGQNVIHYIDTAQNKPCSARLRPLMKGSPKEIKGKEAWMELVEFGIVEPVDVSKPTLWTSALHLQPKKCGGMRPCGDFRQLNGKTQMDKYPLPHLQKFTHKLHGSSIFTKLDIKKAYHHVEIAEEHRHKTAVLTPWGCWQFKKMAMGLANASQSYQRYMDSVLQGLDNVYCYLDDVLIFAKSEAEHLQTVEKVFQRLSE